MPIKLNNWCVQYMEPVTPYMAPEQLCTGLCGEVENHPHHKNGKRVCISRVIHFCVTSEILTTVSGSKYTLGEPLPAYENEHPGARVRMIETLTKWMDRK